LIPKGISINEKGIVNLFIVSDPLSQKKEWFCNQYFFHIAMSIYGIALESISVLTIEEIFISISEKFPQLTVNDITLAYRTHTQEEKVFILTRDVFIKPIVEYWRKKQIIKIELEEQLKKIEDKLRIENKKLFSSGIIYNIPSREMKKTNIFKNPTIGFIGRLEVDRGLWDFLKIVKKLNESGMKLDIKVAGVGKFQTGFIHKLKDINHGEVDYLGQLNSQDISLFWNAINLCIFTAPTESFGRGMRESLSNKIPVWAINSSGLEDLKSKFDADEIMQINASDTKELLVQKLRKSLSLKIDYDYVNFFIKEQNMDLDNLINSWVHN
jgi:glycosyltransferase involved in cell wall biosynthesis